MPTEKIPFNRPFIVGPELHYISQAVLSGHIAGDGQFTRRCNRWLEQKLEVGRAFLTHSCTAALEIAAILCEVGPGDEVIMPSYTFVSTANAFALRGAIPRFVEIRPDTLNLDETLIGEHINDRTRAIVPVHYAGVGCEMDAISDLAHRHGLWVIEDAAQAVSATYKGRHLGSLGHLGCFSFHETKNFISGEGGALGVNEEKLVERTEIIREKGTNRSQFFRGEIDKYSWVDIGSSYLPSEIVAAFLYAQLENCDRINDKRRKIFDLYAEHLEPLAEESLIRLPHVPPHCHHNAHMFYILLRNEKARNDLLDYLRQRKIHPVFHYVPLHTSPMGRKLGYSVGSLPVTEEMSGRLLRLPFYFELTEDEQMRIVEEVFSYFRILRKH